jgi:hypothetical protein
MLKVNKNLRVLNTPQQKTHTSASLTMNVISSTNIFQFVRASTIHFILKLLFEHLHPKYETGSGPQCDLTVHRAYVVVKQLS